MYAPYPISLNPFKSALYASFLRERGYAVKIAAEGGFSDNEQLVWVLWKILKGDGNDVHTLFSSSVMPLTASVDWSLLSEHADQVPASS